MQSKETSFHEKVSLTSGTFKSPGLIVIKINGLTICLQLNDTEPNISMNMESDFSFWTQFDWGTALYRKNRIWTFKIFYFISWDARLRIFEPELWFKSFSFLCDTECVLLTQQPKGAAIIVICLSLTRQKRGNFLRGPTFNYSIFSGGSRRSSVRVGWLTISETLSGSVRDRSSVHLPSLVLFGDLTKCTYYMVRSGTGHAHRRERAKWRFPRM